MVPALACATLLAAWVGWHGTASAQAVPPGEEGQLGDVVAPIPGRQACFTRRYDTAHLKAHPAQTVTAMALRIRYERHEPDAAYPQGQRNYYFTLSANLKGHRGSLISSGECGPREGAIVCMVECDGGGFGLRREAKGSVLLDLTRFGRLRLSRGCEENAVELLPGVDDRRFRLSAAGAKDCAFADE